MELFFLFLNKLYFFHIWNQICRGLVLPVSYFPKFFFWWKIYSVTVEGFWRQSTDVEWSSWKACWRRRKYGTQLPRLFSRGRPSLHIPLRLRLANCCARFPSTPKPAWSSIWAWTRQRCFRFGFYLGFEFSWQICLIKLFELKIIFKNIGRVL